MPKTRDKNWILCIALSLSVLSASAFAQFASPGELWDRCSQLLERREESPTFHDREPELSMETIENLEAGYLPDDSGDAPHPLQVQMRPEMVGEEDRDVRYIYEAAQREIFRVYIHDGKLYDYRGYLLCDGGPCEGIFVMSGAGRIYFHREDPMSPTQGRLKFKTAVDFAKFLFGLKKPGVFKHSTFFAGGSVSAAGNIRLNEGVVEFADTGSGHYQPTWRVNIQFLRELKLRGAPLPKRIGYYDRMTGAGNRSIAIEELIANPEFGRERVGVADWEGLASPQAE